MALGVQYLPLAVGMAVLFQSERLAFVLGAVCLALVTALTVEFAWSRIWPASKRSSSNSGPGAAAVLLVTVVGALATLGGALFGSATYQTQVGRAAASPLASVFTPFAVWLLIGCGLALYSYSQTILSRRVLLIVLLVSMGTMIVYASLTAITAPLMEFMFAVAMGAVVSRVISVRFALLTMLVAILVWPVVYQLRNDQRFEVGGQSAQVIDPLQKTAFDRLREDRLLSNAARYGRLDVPQPSPVTLLRFGLVPRVLDPERGELPAGKLLNAALGGSDRSSNTFTLLGGIWSLNGGWWGITFYVSCVAGFVAMVLRRLSASRLCIVMLTISNLLWIESTYPDNVAALLQNLVGLAVALFAIRVLPLGARRVNARISGRPLAVPDAGVW